MSNKSPVNLFYEQIEHNRVQAQLSASMETKPKRGRPRKNKLYFTQDTENAIIAYNQEPDNILRNKVFNDYIHKPLFKMAENLIHRYKFYHFDAATKDVQHEVIAFLLEKLPKYTQNKGKAPILEIDTQRNVTNEIIRGEVQSEIQDFYHLFIQHCEDNIDTVIKYKRDIPIAYAVLEIFKNCENIETYNKKALYIMVREMVNVKTQYITRVVNILKEEYKRLWDIYKGY